MPRVVFTDKVIRKIKPTKKQVEVWDSSWKIPGSQFGVRVYKSGRKEFIVRYRKDGRRPMMRLGEVLVISLADARKQARKYIGQVHNDGDPAALRDAIRASKTFQELADEFIKFMQQRVASGVRRSRTVAEYQRLLKKDVLPSFGVRKICDITRADVIAIILHMEVDRQCPSQARRLRATLHRMFSYAVERGLVSTSPCTHLPKNEKAIPKDRFLKENEILPFWNATASVTTSMGMIYRMILLTGQRPGEVSGMRWSEINDGVWTIPSIRVKNKREQTVPLSNMASEQLGIWKKLLVKRWSRRFREGRPIDRDLVFPARSSKGETQYLNKSCRKMVEDNGLNKFTPHDLRRTAASQIRRLGFGRDTVSLILNHTVAGVLAHYDHYQGLKEKHQALEAWGEEVRRLKSGSCAQEKVA